jgi:hypothetical protein
MLVYARIEGETPPEAVLLANNTATVQELIDQLAGRRSVAGRGVRLLAPAALPETQLQQLGIKDGDLVSVAVDGPARRERTVAAPAEAPSPEEPGTENGATPRRRGERRRLSEYEEVTRLLQWHPPYHMDAGVRPRYAVWADANSALLCGDWDAYRAPDKLYYRTYTAQQAKADRAVSTAFDFADQTDALKHVDTARLDGLRDLIPALQYPEWGLCIANQYVTRFAMSSWIAGAAEFMMFDELRHAQLYGRLGLAFDEAHGGFDQGRERWMSSARLQPVRKLIEEYMALLDWGQSFIVGGLIVEPLLTEAAHAMLADGAVRAGDWLVPFACQSILNDKRRHRADVEAFVTLVTQDSEHGSDNLALIDTWCQLWKPQATDAVRLLAGDSPTAPEAIADTEAWISDKLSRRAIVVPAESPEE